MKVALRSITHGVGIVYDINSHKEHGSCKHVRQRSTSRHGEVKGSEKT